MGIVADVGNADYYITQATIVMMETASLPRSKRYKGCLQAIRLLTLAACTCCENKPTKTISEQLAEARGQ